MDPLSVPASIVGLVAAAGKITSLLYEFTNARGTQSLAQCIMAEVHAINSTICEFQKFLWGDKRKTTREREAMIMVEHLVVTLTACVHTFSELEKEVNDLKSDEGMKIIDRVKWVLKEGSISGLYQRLKSHKSALALMLGILELKSQAEAQKNLDKLSAFVTQQIDTQKGLPVRLKKLEAALIRSAQAENPEAAAAASLPGTTALMGISHQSTLNLKKKSFVLDLDLQVSKVNRRTFWDKLGPKSPRLHFSPSMDLSRLSLADIPNIGTLTLPIYSFEISNSQWYTFTNSTEAGGEWRAGTPTDFAPRPLPPMLTTQPKMDYLLRVQQKKAIGWRSSASEPHPHLSLAQDPVELEDCLNELWASAYTRCGSDSNTEGGGSDEWKNTSTMERSKSDTSHKYTQSGSSARQWNNGSDERDGGGEKLDSGMSDTSSITYAEEEHNNKKYSSIKDAESAFNFDNASVSDSSSFTFTDENTNTAVGWAL